MASKFDKALPGFNSNLKHGGKIYHIQTEDSGKAHPHIITHVFVDGNIVATQKESYEEFLGRGNIDDIIMKMMKKQHKAMAGKISAGLLGIDKGFSVEVEIGPDSMTPEAEGMGQVEQARPALQEVVSKSAAPAKRTSGIYKKIYRREPTPIPFVPSKDDRKRMSNAEKGALSYKRKKKVFMAGQEVGAKEKQDETAERESEDKTLEEIIANYLSEKLVK